jgi:hypothetical protein
LALVYFDASALVKEPGSGLAGDLWDGCDAALSSRLGYRLAVAPANLP